MLAPALLGIAILAQDPASAAARDYAPGDVYVRELEGRVREQQEARRQIKAAPGSAAAVRALLWLEQVDEGLDALLHLVQTQPRAAADALPGLNRSNRLAEGVGDYSAKLRAVAAAAHEQAARLPREDAAALEIALAVAGVDSMAGRVTASDANPLTTVVARFAGTRAAAMAEITYRHHWRRTIEQSADALDAIARAHRGTDIAAAAIYEKGRVLAHNPATGYPDPIDRFRSALAIAAELGSGAYPKSAWTDAAASVVFLFNPRPAYTPEHLDEAIAGYRAFARAHFRLDPISLDRAGAGFMVTSTMVELFALKGDADGVDRLLRELETDSPDPHGARYLRALLTPRGSPLRDQRLDAIAADPSNAYAPKALATQGWDALQQLTHAAVARDKFRQFLQRYPQSGYAWLAALHAAEADAAVGDWASAERGFLKAASAYPSSPLAVVLGRAFAGDAAESQGQPARALDHFTAAVAAWDGQIPEVSLYTTRGESRVFRRPDVERRIATLRASLAHPGGEILERARSQLTRGDHARAVASLGDFLTRYPKSPALSEANLLLHRARLETALELVGPDGCGRDCAAAAAGIDAVSGQPLDSAVVAAHIARASLLWTHGESDEARRVIASALADWIKVQPHRQPETGLEKDVAAIREVLFRPRGDGIFREGFAGSVWPAAPFLLVDPDVNVTLGSGDEQIVTVTKALPEFPGAVIADKTMLDLLERMVDVFGEDVLLLWRPFFPARLDSSSEVTLTADPRLTRVEFLDAARTRAAAYVSVGDSDATVQLEKRGAAWTAVTLTKQ